MSQIEPTQEADHDPAPAMPMQHLGRCRLVDLPVVHDRRGNLTAIQGEIDVPFQIERVYYTYDIPGGAMRGGHAHRECEALVIALSGSFDVSIDDGAVKARVHLNRSYFGLFIPTMVWRELDNFSTGSVCMVLASTPYEETEYIRDYATFEQEIGR